MTVSNTPRRASYTRDGSTTSYAVPFRFLTNAEIVATKRNLAGVESTLVLDTDYTLTGGTPNGTITFPNGGVNGERVVIITDMPYSQPDSYPETGNFPAKTAETGLDRLTLFCQQLAEKVSRALLVNITGSVTNITLGDPVANSALIWDATAQKLISGPTADQIANANDDAVDAENSAISSANSASISQNWAISAAIVQALDYSAKAWAISIGLISAGSAKEWATKLTTAVDAGLFSARQYAINAAASAASTLLPASIAGKALNFLRVNAGETGYEHQTAAQVAAQLYPTQDWAGVNLIQNGAFDVWQFSTTFALLSATQYTADQTAGNAGGGSGAATASRIAADYAAGHQSRYAYQHQQTVAATTTGPTIMRKFVEGVNTLHAASGLISCYARVTSGTLNVQPQSRQHFGTGGAPSASVVTPHGAPITLTTAWQRIQVPCAIPSISGKTLGTNNDDHLELELVGPTGVTFTAQIEEFDFRRGSGFDQFHFNDAATELARCQRFYWQQGGGIVGETLAFGWCFTTTVPYTRHEFPVPMRAAPVMTYDAKATLFQILTGSGSAAANVPGSFSVETGNRSATVTWPSSAAITAGYGLLIRILTNGQALFWNARLPTP